MFGKEIFTSRTGASTVRHKTDLIEYDGGSAGIDASVVGIEVMRVDMNARIEKLKHALVNLGRLENERKPNLRGYQILEGLRKWTIYLRSISFFEAVKSPSVSTSIPVLSFRS